LKATSRGSFHAAASGSHGSLLRYTFLDCMSDAEPRIYKENEVVGIGAGSHLRKTAPCRRTVASTAVGEQICLPACNKRHAKYPAGIREEAHQQCILSNFAECTRKNLVDVIQVRGHITTRFPTMKGLERRICWGEAAFPFPLLAAVGLFSAEISWHAKIPISCIATGYPRSR